MFISSCLSSVKVNICLLGLQVEFKPLKLLGMSVLISDLTGVLMLDRGFESLAKFSAYYGYASFLADSALPLPI